jgi:hypothetical protein
MDRLETGLKKNFSKQSSYEDKTVEEFLIQATLLYNTFTFVNAGTHTVFVTKIA